jgi:hypothetical protein
MQAINTDSRGYLVDQTLGRPILALTFGGRFRPNRTPRGPRSVPLSRLVSVILRITRHSSLEGHHRSAVKRVATMAKKQSRRAKRHVPKAVLRLPDLDQAKSAVLNSLSSVDAQRGYRHAIDEFVEWYCSEPRLSFSKTVALRYRIHLEPRHLAPGTINLRLGGGAPPGV